MVGRRGCRRFLAGQWQMWGLRKGPGCQPWSRVRGVSGAGTPFWGGVLGWRGWQGGRQLVQGEVDRGGLESRSHKALSTARLGFGCARLRFSHLFLTADSNLRSRQVRFVELHPSGQPRPERPGHIPKAGPWPQPKGQDISHAQR